MPQKPVDLDTLSLWPHQKDAVDTVQKYIRAYQDEDTTKSALVQMPTGSGKSGIIAVLSRLIPDIGLTLVLAPRISLRDQLYRDINSRFFTHINYPTDELPKNILKLTKSKRLVLGYLPEELVIVMTIQMLVSLAKNNNEGLFSRLSEQTSLLIVDEGHYEPAYKWSKIIREILAPKVIFTATPYRNDFKVFDIDQQHIHILSFRTAQSDRYLRQVRVENRPSIAKGTPRAFVDDILDFYESTFPNPGDNPPKVIIRCDDSASIRHLASALEQRGKSVIGIHETFSKGNNESWERKHVPDPENEDAVFWIHQFKLLEGIDDPRFQVLAIYERIRSARSLVQQVGRIIRNPARLAGAIGYFLEHWDGYHSNLWHGFLEYDKAINEHGVEALFLSTGEGILPKLIQLQPKIAYMDGRFRSEFDFRSISPEEDIQLPLKVNLFKKLDNFDINELSDSIFAYLKEQDRVVERYPLSDNVHVILSVRCNSSPFLRSHTFLEADLHVTVLREFTDYICIYDSSGLNVIGWSDVGIGHSLDVETLKKLFRQSDGTKLTKVSLINSNLGTSAIRSRTVTAASIEATIPGFDDYAQICTIAEGYSSDQASSITHNGSVHRYVGFSRGRIAQSCSGYKPLRKYLEWLTSIQNVIGEGATSLPVLSRYALEKKVPDQIEPRSILLDLEDVRENYVLADDEEQYIEIKDTCSTIENGIFRIDANSQEVEVEIKFESGRYHLKSGNLESRYICQSEDFPKSIIKYLNRTQSFRVLPEDLTSVYVRGQFYKPAMKVGRDFDADTYQLGYCFVTDNLIGQCRSEKGNKAYYDVHDHGWDPDSLFGIISRLGNSTGVSNMFGNPDIMVCDDGGTEIADFILCDTNQKRVVFIHAKASSDDNHLCYTSASQVACAQAIKNLGYLAMFNDNAPSKLNSWDSSWNAKVSGGTGAVQKRIHKAEVGDNAGSIWRKIRSAINNPLVEKEVWLFLGNVMSKVYFEKELAKNNPLPHVVQGAYLLHATMSDVASVGAKLRIFCKE